MYTIHWAVPLCPVCKICFLPPPSFLIRVWYYSQKYSKTKFGEHKLILKYLGKIRLLKPSYRLLIHSHSKILPNFLSHFISLRYMRADSYPNVLVKTFSIGVEHNLFLRLFHHEHYPFPLTGSLMTYTYAFTYISEITYHFTSNTLNVLLFAVYAFICGTFVHACCLLRVLRVHIILTNDDVIICGGRKRDDR